VGPFQCAPISVEWMKYAIGALSQLRMPSAWLTSTEADVDSIMHQVDAFIGMIATASMCPELGLVSVTISIGDSAGTVNVTFPVAFASTPVIVVSSDNPDVIASYSTPSSSGFIAVLTANVPVIIAITAAVSWVAGPAT
jgi:hypothetical protein